MRPGQFPRDGIDRRDVGLAGGNELHRPSVTPRRNHSGDAAGMAKQRMTEGSMPGLGVGSVDRSGRLLDFADRRGRMAVSHDDDGVVVTWIGCRQAVIEGADHRDGIKEMSPQREATGLAQQQRWISPVGDGFVRTRSLDRCVDAEFVEALPDRAPQPVEGITDLGPVVHRQ